ncbi:MAG: bifunctional diguanylate cyclase/phosphodiesterase, partial [Myxococcota bacterium]
MSAALRALTQLTRELQRAHPFKGLLELITERCSSLMAVERASVRILDPTGTRLLAICRAGTPLHVNPNESFEVGEGLLGWIVDHGAPLRTGNASFDPRYVERASMVKKLNSFLGVPLIAGDTTLGVMSVSSEEPDAFQEQDEELLTLLAGIAAPHIEIARRDFVVRDPLTGLFNHAHFQDMLEEEIDRSVAYGLPFSLVLVDVDQFARFNDTRGHQRGDHLLRAISELLIGRRPGQPLASAGEKQFRLRAQDIVARYGGDEFAVILPHTPKSGGLNKGEQLRELIADYDFGGLGLPQQQVSVGVAAVPDDAHDRAGLISAAEHAVRAAKRSGRNTTVPYSRALAVASALEDSMAIDLDKFLALDTTIENLRFRYVYQPIVDSMTHAIVAYEALCRPSHQAFPGPADLFETAEHADRVIDLGRACRTVSTEPLEELPEGALLFINLHPHELDDDSLLKDARVLQFADRIVFEVTETSAIEDYDSVRRAIARLRDL